MSEPTKPSIEEIRDGLQRLINSHFHQEPSARIRIPASRDDDDLMVSDAITELAALREWRAKAEPALLDFLNDHRDEDGDCLFCQQPRRVAHKDDCSVTIATALLGEGGQGS